MPIKIKQYPEQKTLKELFDYKDGNLYRKKNCKLAGNNSHNKGYWRLSINKQVYYINRLIYIWHFGDIPDGYEIDHKDLDKNNNKIENLQAVPHSVNKLKMKMSYKNKSGHTGVFFCNTYLKWVACINIKGKQKGLGMFDDIKPAIKARKEAEKEYGYDKLHGTTFDT